MECTGIENTFNHISQGCELVDLSDEQTEIVSAITKVKCNSCNAEFQPREWQNDTELKCYGCSQFFNFPDEFAHL